MINVFKITVQRKPIRYGLLWLMSGALLVQKQIIPQLLWGLCLLFLMTLMVNMGIIGIIGIALAIPFLNLMSLAGVHRVQNDQRFAPFHLYKYVKGKHLVNGLLTLGGYHLVYCFFSMIMATLIFVISSDENSLNAFTTLSQDPTLMNNQEVINSLMPQLIKFGISFLFFYLPAYLLLWLAPMLMARYHVNANAALKLCFFALKNNVWAILFYCAMLISINFLGTEIVEILKNLLPSIWTFFSVIVMASFMAITNASHYSMYQTIFEIENVASHNKSSPGEV